MYKILLVEDDKETADFVKQGFEIEGIDVDIAYDGVDGYEKYLKSEYDLILLDLEMPRMNGEELLVKIRNINPYIDIIVYTNYQEKNQDASFFYVNFKLAFGFTAKFFYK